MINELIREAMRGALAELDGDAAILEASDSREATPSGQNGSHSITPVGESRAATDGTVGRQPQAKPHPGESSGEPGGCLLRLKPRRHWCPRRSIEWVRNIDGRQDKTAPGDPVELGLVAGMNRAATSNGIISLLA